jgi:DnaD/phage-associated family protein
MNYIKEINSFYDWLETNPLASSCIVLWYALMHIANKAGWPDTFAVAISVLEVKTGLKKDTIYDARNKLQQVRRIEWNSRRGNQSAVYKIIPFNSASEKPTQIPTQSPTQIPTQSPMQSSTINKLNETKQNNDVDDTPQTPFEVVVKIFRESGMGEINSTIADILGSIADNHPLELIEEAFLIAGANHATSVRYVEKILIAWAEKGIKSKQQLELYENNRRRGNGSSKGDNGRSSGEPDPYADIGITL